jgi:lipase maturation factor 1
LPIPPFLANALKDLRIFYRLLGLIYLFAFGSQTVQIVHLIGAEGLLPITPYLERLGAVIGPERFWLFPTVFWLGSGDFVLQLLIWTGLTFSIFLILGASPKPLLVALLLLYLSLVTAGRDFFAFQWDNLLLEATFLSLFLPRRGRPGAIPLFLMRWLVFRLYFESGLSKVLAPGGGWLDGTAMDTYYETAPLPTLLGWCAHQLPHWFHKFETYFVLFVELVAPFMIFMGRRPRQVAFVLFSVFQITIFLTANYGFFSPLCLILGLFLLVDTREKMPHATKKRPWKERWLRGATVILAILVVYSSLVEMGTVAFRGAWREKVSDLRQPFSRFRLVNAYHLFANVTKTRLVLRIEGTQDGKRWEPYRLRYAIGGVRTPPKWVAPHHPRLDFQTWFLTLGRGVEYEAYWLRLIDSLLNRPQAVAHLFRENPFPQDPPRSIRVTARPYRMNDVKTLKLEGRYWNHPVEPVYSHLYSSEKPTP